MKKTVLVLSLIVFLFVAIIAVPVMAENSNVVKTSNAINPIPKPQNERPRVFINKSMIPALREKAAKDEYKEIIDRLKETADRNLDGKLAPVEGISITNYDARATKTMLANALLYIVTDDKSYGRKAGEIATNIADTIDWNKQADIYYVARDTGEILLELSVVYDWCYSLLSKENRSAIIAALERIITGALEYPYPMKEKDKAVLGLHSNGNVTHNMKLAMAIALYDTNPEYYNDIADFLLNISLPAFNAAYDAGMYFEGSAYGSGRMDTVLKGVKLWQAIGVDIMNPKIGELVDRYTYTRRPDGFIMSESDDYQKVYATPNQYVNIATLSYMISGAEYGNKLAQYEFFPVIVFGFDSTDRKHI